MNGYEFIVGVLGALAWPTVAAMAILTFRDKISELILKMIRLKHKDTEIEFERSVQELKKEVDAFDELQEEIEDLEPEQQSQIEFLERLADISPRSAVLESWRSVEEEAAKAAVRSNMVSGAAQVRPYNAIKNLEKRLTAQDRHILHELRQLRNMAAHSEDFNLRGMSVEAFINLSLTMASRFREMSREGKL